MSQRISIELPDALYESVERVAAATQRSTSQVIAEQLAAGLPPLDDVPADEAVALAALAALSDAELWQVARQESSEVAWETLSDLLEMQGTGALTDKEQSRLNSAMARYGERLVLQSHAWLLLARRGYNVPPQRTATE